MDISLINSQSLLHLINLTEKKEELLQILNQIDSEIISVLKGGVFVGVVTEARPVIAPPAPALNKPVAAAPVKAEAPAKPAKKAKKAKSRKSGGLKDRILTLLESAGDQGLRVKDIAAKLGAKAANISVWFSTTGKKITTKLEPGRYAVKGSAVAAKPVAGSLKPVSLKKATVKKVKRGRKTTKASKNPF